MENSLPLNDFQVKKTEVILNRTHIFLHGIALLALFHYRITTLIQLINTNNKMTLFPYVLIFSSEIVLSFLWVLSQPSKWRPIKRQVYVERLPENDKLPSIDVLICTADPNKEPSLGVMNTVVSALALDYPPNKLHVYLSDDGGCFSTFRAVQEAWKFSKVWIRFCRKYEVKNRCPEAYFLNDESNGNGKFDRTSEFGEEKKKIQERYDDFKDRLVKIIADTGGAASRNHPTMIERWNSTFRMIQEAIPMEKAITRFCETHKNLGAPQCSIDDWRVCKILVPFLKRFDKVTKCMSPVYTPTSNDMLMHLVRIVTLFEKVRKQIGYNPLPPRAGSDSETDGEQGDDEDDEQQATRHPGPPTETELSARYVHWAGLGRPGPGPL